MRFEDIDRGYGRCLAVVDSERCPRNAYVKRLQLCNAHYLQEKAGKAYTTPREVDDSRKCSFPECDRPYFANTYCSAHNQQAHTGRELSEIGSYVRTSKASKRDEKGRKQCFECLSWLEESQFAERNSRTPDGLSRACKDCVFWRGVKYSYRLNREDYTKILETQGRTCAICESPDPRHAHGRWNVDHDHRCCPGKTSCGGCVRGLLCGPCNAGIGLLQDSPKILESARNYLKDWRYGND